MEIIPVSVSSRLGLDFSSLAFPKVPSPRPLLSPEASVLLLPAVQWEFSALTLTAAVGGFIPRGEPVWVKSRQLGGLGGVGGSAELTQSPGGCA